MAYRRLGFGMVFALCGWLAGTPPAHAQTAAVQSTLKEARTACEDGRVEDGIAILAEHYLATQHPNFIYNQGRCYEDNHRLEEAVERFNLYLERAGSLPRKERDMVRARITRLEKRLARTARKAPPADPPAVLSAPDPDTSSVPVPPPLQSEKVVAAPHDSVVDLTSVTPVDAGDADRKTPLYRRPWFWVATTAVVAAAVVGFALAAGGTQRVGFDCPTCVESAGVGR